MKLKPKLSYLPTIQVSLFSTIMEIFLNFCSITHPLHHPISVQSEISRLDPHTIASGTGTLGRLADELSSEYSVNTFAVDTSLLALEGKTKNIPRTAVNSEVGFQKFNPSALEEDVINSQFASINSEQETSSNLFGQTWSSSLVSATLAKVGIFVCFYLAFQLI